MLDSDLINFIDDSANVLSIIYYLEDVFPSVHAKACLEIIKDSVTDDVYYSIDPEDLKRDASSYYMTGHCLSFAKILLKIFKCGELYNNSEHVVAKIGDTLFDIGGIVRLNLDADFYPSIESGYADICLKTTDAVDDKISDWLVSLGIDKLRELIKNNEVSHYKSQFKKEHVLS